MKTIHFEELYHIGTLNPEHKGRESHEGAGLSVSLHPDAWRKIARLGGFPLHTLQKENNQFLDYYESLEDKSFEERILSWGLEKGYIAPATIYHVEYWDDELECVVRGSYTNKKVAEDEYEPYEEDEEAKLYSTDGYISLSPLQERTRASVSPSFVLPLLTTVFVEDETELDGVWWEEKLDVYAYSAPRGVIIPKRVNEWNVTQTK